MASQKKRASRLRQTTLLESPRAPTARSSSSKINPESSQFKRKRTADSSQHHSSDDDTGLRSIRFEVNNNERSADEDKARAAPKRRKTLILDSDDSDHAPPKSTNGRRKATVSRKSDDDDDEAEKPRRRKLKKKRDVALVSESEDEDLAQEVEKEHIIANRLRARDKKTRFQKNLDKLRRRKQGKKVEVSSSSSEETEDDDTPFKGAQPSSDYDSLFDDDSSDHSSAFIVEDDNMVVPALPMQFSMESHEDLDHKFKKIFQFFVHIAVRPAKERHYFMEDQLQREEYFAMPLKTVRRELFGLRDSLVASSVWRPGFKTSLGTYPKFELIPLEFAVPSCEACHLGGRMSSLVGRLSGLPYDPLGFEIKETDGSDSSESENDEEKDKLSTVDLHLGRFCARRTRVYHEFTHWEYALFKCIRDEVDELHESDQSNGFFRIAYAGGIAPPDDLDDADAICEWLDQRKVIDIEWMKIKAMMESARRLELDNKRGEVD